MVTVLIISYCACAVILVVGGVRGDGGGGGGGGGGDSSAAACWSIDPAREIGIHGVRIGHTKDAILETASLPLDRQQLCLVTHTYIMYI